jgi:hypothetical protein
MRRSADGAPERRRRVGVPAGGDVRVRAFEGEAAVGDRLTECPAHATADVRPRRVIEREEVA